MSDIKYKRVLLKLSGEALAGDQKTGINPEVIGKICDQIKVLVEMGVEVSIVVGGDRSGGQELAIQQINTFYLLNKIIPLSGGSFGANLGACLWSQDDGAEGVKEDEYGLKTLDMTINHFKEFLLEFKS